MSLRVSVKQGQTALAHLTIRNAGGRTLSWTVESAPGWLRLDRLSGELGFGGEQKLVVVADASTLEAGTEAGEIVIAAPGGEGSPVTISVAAEVIARRGTASAGPPRLEDLPARAPDYGGIRGRWDARLTYWPTYVLDTRPGGKGEPWNMSTAEIGYSMVLGRMAVGGCALIGNLDTKTSDGAEYMRGL